MGHNRSKFIFLTSVTMAAQPAGLPPPSQECKELDKKRKHAAIEKRIHTDLGVHKHEQTHTLTQTLTYKNTYTRSE